jgi:hypothetical protein
MKDRFTGRENLGSRISSVDGTIHPNRSVRDSYDAMKRFEQSRKSWEEMRHSSEDARKGLKESRQKVELARRKSEHIPPSAESEQVASSSSIHSEAAMHSGGGAGKALGLVILAIITLSVLVWIFMRR